jgi:hypothetical protein
VQTREKPLLLVDVDGVLSLWGFPSDRRPPGTFVNVDGIVHFLSADAGPHLLRLARSFELAWCTGWDDRANLHLPYALGLPGDLPTITFFERSGHEHAHWKLGGIDAFAGPERPLAWVDDAFDETCHAWARARSGPTHLERTHPATGLTGDGVLRLEAFAAALSPASPST